MFPKELGNRIPYGDSAVGLIRTSPAYGGEWIDAHPEWVRALDMDYGLGAIVLTGPREAEVWQYAPWEPNALSYVLLLPDSVTIKGMFITNSVHTFYGAPSGYMDTVIYGSITAKVEVSSNTTNGVDGDWISLGDLNSRYPAASRSASTYAWDTNHTGLVFGTGVNYDGKLARNGPSYAPYTSTFRVMGDNGATAWNMKSGPNSDGVILLETPVRGVTAVRISFDQATGREGWSEGAYSNRLHLYGDLETTFSTQGKIAAWSSDRDERLKYSEFDFRNLPRASSTEVKFRLKNLSTTQGAVGVEMFIPPVDFSTSATVASSQVMFSMDGETWTERITLLSLTSGSVSPTIHARIIVPKDAEIEDFRLKAQILVQEWR